MTLKNIFVVCKESIQADAEKTAESVRLGVLLAIAGGFLDAYTFIGRDGVFANAQTGNLVIVAVQSAMGHWWQALLSLFPILAFGFGVIISEWLKGSTHPFVRSDHSRAILLLEIVVLFVIGFLPSSFSNVFVTVAISFVSSLQIATFRTLVNSSYSTTMITGNLRSGVDLAFHAWRTKEKKTALQAVRYFSIILSFAFGACLGGVMTVGIGDKAIFAVVFILFAALMMFLLDRQRTEKV